MSEHGHTDTIANLRAALNRAVAERNEMRAENVTLSGYLETIRARYLQQQRLIDACRSVYLAEMNQFRDHTEPDRRDMCGVDPSSVELHRAKERLLVECRKLWGVEA